MRKPAHQKVSVYFVNEKKINEPVTISIYNCKSGVNEAKRQLTEHNAIFK